LFVTGGGRGGGGQVGGRSCINNNLNTYFPPLKRIFHLKYCNFENSLPRLQQHYSVSLPAKDAIYCADTLYSIPALVSRNFFRLACEERGTDSITYYHFGHVRRRIGEIINNSQILRISPSVAEDALQSVSKSTFFLETFMDQVTLF
jgi:hypothetical protein